MDYVAIREEAIIEISRMQRATFTRETPMDIKQIVADPEWQAIRGAFVGTWKKTPAENVAVLRAYLYTTDQVEYLRWRRVYNYLTGSAFRIGVIAHPDIDTLLAEVRALRPTMSE